MTKKQLAALRTLERALVKHTSLNGWGSGSTPLSVPVRTETLAILCSAVRHNQSDEWQRANPVFKK